VCCELDSGTVADKALRLAHGLQDAGVGRDSRVSIWGAQLSGLGSWRRSRFGAAGAVVVVPIDDLADAEQFEAALTSAAVRLIFTTMHHLEASGDILRDPRCQGSILIDEPERAGQSATGWLSVLGERTDDLPGSGSRSAGPAVLDLRHYRLAQGILADASQHCDQRRGFAGTGCRRAARSRAAASAIAPRLPVHSRHADHFDRRDRHRLAGRHDRSAVDAGDA